MIKAIKDTVLLEEKDQVLKVHFFIKMLQKGIRPFERDIDIIIELYNFGGYTNSEQQARFIDSCIKKGYRKSVQSLRNTLSKYVSMGVFEKSKNTTLKISDLYLPKMEFSKLILIYTIGHAK